MIAQRPEIALFRPVCALPGVQRGTQVERLHSLPLLPRVEGPEELRDLVVVEAGEREVDLGDCLQLGK